MSLDCSVAHLHPHAEHNKDISLEEIQIADSGSTPLKKTIVTILAPPAKTHYETTAPNIEGGLQSKKDGIIRAPEIVIQQPVPCKTEEVRTSTVVAKARSNTSEEEESSKPIDVAASLKAFLHEKRDKKPKVALSEIIKDIAQNSCLHKHIGNLHNPRYFNERNCELDGGEKPGKLKTGKCNFNDKNVHVPKSSASRLIVEYAECTPLFETTSHYDKSGLAKNRISREEFEQTINNANELMMPYRGVVAKSEFKLFIILFVGLLLAIICGLVIGMLASPYAAIAIVAVYVIIVAGSMIYVKKRNARLLKIAHVLLALFIRCENNRLYLRRRVLLRPGFQGKWIEFNMKG